MKRIIKKLFWDVFFVLSSWKISGLLFQPIMFFFKRHISFSYNRKKYFSCKTFTLSHQHKSLPETQWTQSIDSISSVNLSSRIVHKWFQWQYLNWIGCKFGHQMAPIAFIFGLSVAVGWVSSIVTLPFYFMFQTSQNRLNLVGTSISSGWTINLVRTFFWW